MPRVRDGLWKKKMTAEDSGSSEKEHLSGTPLGFIAGIWRSVIGVVGVKKQMELNQKGQVLWEGSIVSSVSKLFSYSIFQAWENDKTG